MSYLIQYPRALSGTWSRQTDDSFKGIVDGSQSARAIKGSETDQDYEYYATVNIHSGTAALIVNFTYDTDWYEYYLEMILDPTNNIVKLDAVKRDPDGVEVTRATLAARNIDLSTDTDYKVRVVSREIDTNVFAVYGYVDEFMVVQAEDLATNYNIGMYGLECLGTSGQYSTFANVKCFGITALYTTVENAKRSAELISYADLGFNTEASYQDYVEQLILSASRAVDHFCKRPEGFFNGGTTIVETHDGKEYDSSDFYELPSRAKEKRTARRTFWLNQTPILSVTLVEENYALIGESDDWRTVSSANYRVNMKTGKVLFATGSTPRPGHDNVRFTYKAGHSALPQDVSIACGELVGREIRRRLEHYGKQAVNWGRPTPLEFATDVFGADLKQKLRSYVKRRN